MRRPISSNESFCIAFPSMTRMLPQIAPRRARQARTPPFEKGQSRKPHPGGTRAMLLRPTIRDLHAVLLNQSSAAPLRWMPRTALVVTGGAHLWRRAGVGGPKARSHPAERQICPVLGLRICETKRSLKTASSGVVQGVRADTKECDLFRLECRTFLFRHQARRNRRRLVLTTNAVSHHLIARDHTAQVKLIRWVQIVLA